MPLRVGQCASAAAAANAARSRRRSIAAHAPPAPAAAGRRRRRPAPPAGAAAGAGAGDADADDAGASEAAAAARRRRQDGGAELTREILALAVPVLAMLAADPVAGLADLAILGRLGAAQLAGAGIALSIFNSLGKLFNIPLLSVTTTSVAAAVGAAKARAAAEGAADGAAGVDAAGGEAIASAISSALAIAAVVGVAQMAVLLTSLPWAVPMWGVQPGAALHAPVVEFLVVRALGAPATVLLLVMQGVFRGLADTRTPLYATLACSALNVALNVLFVFGLGMGVRGAALGTVIAQAVPVLVLGRMLASRHRLSASDGATLRSVLALFRPTGFLIARTLSITLLFAFATATAARAGAAAAATHQIALSVTLAASLLADAVAVAAQALVAQSVAAGDAERARRVAARSVAMAAALGAALMVAMAAAAPQIPRLFTADAGVLALMGAAMPFVVLTQPVNAVAFALDGVLFGVPRGFAFAAPQMAACAAPAAALMALGARSAAGPAASLVWVWSGMALLMALRAATIGGALAARVGPFRALRPADAAAAGKGGG